MSKINPKQLFVNKFKLTNASKTDIYHSEEIARINSITTATLDTIVNSMVGNSVNLKVQDDVNLVRGDGQSYVKVSAINPSAMFSGLVEVAAPPADVKDFLPPGVYHDTTNDRVWVLVEEANDVIDKFKDKFKFDTTDSTVALDSDKTDGTAVGSVKIEDQYINVAVDYFIGTMESGIVLRVTAEP